MDWITSFTRLSFTRRCSSHLRSVSFRTVFQAVSVVPYSGPTMWDDGDVVRKQNGITDAECRFDTNFKTTWLTWENGIAAIIIKTITRQCATTDSTSHPHNTCCYYYYSTSTCWIAPPVLARADFSTKCFFKKKRVEIFKIIKNFVHNLAAPAPAARLVWDICN